MRGRRPKPSALKKLQGNPGRRRLNDDEPAPPVGAPACPDYLGAVARREWERVASMLVGSAILTELDGTTLAAYCQAYEHWVESEKKIRAMGMLVKGPFSYPVVNPYVGIAKHAFAQMHKCLVELGMTPSARARLRIEKPDRTVDPLDAFLKRAPRSARDDPRAVKRFATRCNAMKARFEI